MHDAVIIGGGLVGAAAALALARAGRHVALLEPHPPRPLAILAAEPGWDARVYAISPGNVRWLEQLGVWQHIAAARRQPVTRMDVRGDRDGQLCFDAYEAQVAALAWIVENRQLQAALWQEFAAAGVEVMAARPAAFSASASDIACQLDNGERLTARLLVAADGAASWTRTQAGISVNSVPYQQSGVVANFRCSRPHLATARQWFSQADILAWLPLAGDRMSMVWSAPEALAQELLALDGSVLAQRVAQAGGHALGELELITPAQAFPLRRSRAERVIGERLVLIGDAAHTVHPLAGQGVNLGFHDVRQLVAPLQQGRADDLGTPAMLRAYERSRAEQVLLMQSSCDGLQKLFNRAPGWLAPWRNLGLSFVNRSAWLKRQLIAEAMA